MECRGLNLGGDLRFVARLRSDFEGLSGLCPLFRRAGLPPCAATMAASTPTAPAGCAGILLVFAARFGDGKRFRRGRNGDGYFRGSFFRRPAVSWPAIMNTALAVLLFGTLSRVASASMVFVSGVATFSIGLSASAGTAAFAKRAICRLAA